MISVLYVDDEPALLEIGKLFLEKGGTIGVDTAISATEAKVKLAENRYDAVISDYQMPETDGIEFLKYTRDHFGNIPFILFTGKGREEVVIRAINNGADFYLQKGGESESQFAELGQKIRVAVEKRHAEETLQRQTFVLNERVKELDCLYNLAEIINRPGISLNEMLQHCADLIPSGYQRPECTCARIQYGGREFVTAGFRRSVWNQTSPILVNGEWTGAVEISYTGAWADTTTMPFLAEESTMLNGVANLLGNSIARKATEDLSRKMVADPGYRTAKNMGKADNFGERLSEEMKLRLTAEKHLDESLRQKEALMREISIRVKDNLRTVNSLLDLQSQYIKDEKILKALREGQHRIKAMALVHEILYQSPEISKINLEQYVLKLGDYLFGFYGNSKKEISLKIEIHEVFLGIDTAIPLGLILNELMSNALRHAFPDRNTGEIFISVKKEGNTIPAVFSDNGVGIPRDLNWRDPRSLGMRMVFSLVEQMNGMIGLDRHGGTRFTMVLEERA
jgi:two-component sensor histidine kinase/FixJ family two-component response regulator